MKMTQLSVSSAILAAVLSGCSQQQVIGGSQVSSGSQQVSGGYQVSSQQQIEGGTQVGASQQQVESGTQVAVPTRNVYKSIPQKTRIHRPKPRPTHTAGLPAAQPGQCFAKVKIPATYVTKSRRIFVQKASVKRVFVRAPQYRWTSKKVLVRKPSYRTRVIPAQYKTVSNRVMVKPAYNTWRKGHGAITRIDNMTGDIMCRVKIPAVYRTVKKRVLVRPAKTLRTLVPAVYKTVKQKQRVSAALYKTIKTPARYKTQKYRVKTRGARYVWKAVICNSNAKHNTKRNAVRKQAPRKQYKQVAAAPKRVYQAPRRSYQAPKRVYQAPKRVYQAPKQYRRAAVVRKPVVRTNSYRTQYKKSGVQYQDYLRVMNAGSRNASKQRYQAPRKVMRKVSYKKAVTVKKPSRVRQQSKADTRRGIVYGIQKALKEKGFNPGTMDGKMGAGTAAALKAFQSSRGLPIGKLSKDTFRALGMIR